MKVRLPLMKYLRDFGFQSLFFKMLLSILLCVLTPVLAVGIISYNSFSAALIDQAVERKQESIAQINKLLGADFARIEDAIWAQYNNQWLADVTTLSDPPRYEQMASVVKCINYMQVEQSQSGIYELFIYIRSLDTYITSAKLCESQDFFIRRYGCSVSDAEYFDALMEQTTHYNRYIPFMGNFDTDYYSYNTPPEEPAVMVLTTLRMSGQPVMQVGAVVLGSAIQDKMSEKLSTDVESLSLMDAGGNTIFHVGADRALAQEAGERFRAALADPNSASSGYSIAGGELINYIVNPQTGFYIVSRLPMATILESTRSVKNLTLVLCFLAAAAALGVSFFLSAYFYRPVVGLLENIPDGDRVRGLRQPGGGRSDEFGLLGSSYRQISSQYCAMKELMEKNRDALIARFFRRMCQNKYCDADEVAERMGEVALSFEREQFTVHILSSDAGAVQPNTGAGAAAFEQIYSFISGRIRTAMKSAFDAQVFIYNEYDLITVIINHDVSDSRLGTWAQDFYQELLTAVGSRFSCTYSVGMGQSAGTLMDLNASYDQARKALESRFFLGYGQIHRFRPSCLPEADSLHFTVTQQESLLNAIEFGDEKTALMHSVALVDSLPSSQTGDAAQVRRFMEEIIAVVIDAFREENTPLSAAFAEDCDLMGRLRSMDTCRQWTQFLGQAIARACQWFRDNKQSPEELRSVLLAYVETHYAEEITLDSVARCFRFSPCYFSRYFKTLTGTTLIDCITKVRITNAQKMLTEKNMPIKEVFEKVGYNNYNTFRRAFKRIVGMSPECFKRNAGQWALN